MVGLEERRLEVGAHAARVEEGDRSADHRELGLGLVDSTEVEEELADLGEVLGEGLPGDDVLPGADGILQVALRDLQTGRGDEGREVVGRGLLGDGELGGRCFEPALLALDVGEQREGVRLVVARAVGGRAAEDVGGVV